MKFNKEYQEERLEFYRIRVPKWKRIVVQYVCKLLNVKYISDPPFHLNIKGKGKYDIVNGRMVKKSSVS